MYKALTSFAGLISMRKGEFREISDPALSKDLLEAGYIVEVGGKKAEVVKLEEFMNKPVESEDEPKEEPKAQTKKTKKK